MFYPSIGVWKLFLSSRAEGRTTTLDDGEGVDLFVQPPTLLVESLHSTSNKIETEISFSLSIWNSDAHSSKHLHNLDNLFKFYIVLNVLVTVA